MTPEEAASRIRKAKRYIEEVEAEYPSIDDNWLEAIMYLEWGLRELEE